MSQHSDDSLSTLSSLKSSGVDVIRPVGCPRCSGSEHRRNHAPSPQVSYAPPPSVSLRNTRPEEFKPLLIDPHIVTLVQQMSISGAFTLTDTLGEVVGRHALEEARSWGDKQLAAMALTVVYLEKNPGDHLEMC